MESWQQAVEHEMRTFIPPGVSTVVRGDTPRGTEKSATSTASQSAEFTADTADVEAALAVLAPTRLLWHQDQAGIIPNSCSDKSHTAKGSIKRVQSRFGNRTAEAGANLYWQLYKSLAAYRMALRHETEGGFKYDWIVRTRFDLAWTRPIPPLHFFSKEAVWMNAHYW